MLHAGWGRISRGLPEMLDPSGWLMTNVYIKQQECVIEHGFWMGYLVYDIWVEIFTQSPYGLQRLVDYLGDCRLL